MDSHDLSSIAPERANAIMSQLQRQRRAAAIVVPTDDNDIRLRLRQLGHPITLFGEGRSERRDRLRELLTQKQEAFEAGKVDADGDEQMDDDSEGQEDDAEEDPAQAEFWSEGNEAILAVRQEISRLSMKRAARRIMIQKLAKQIPLRTHVRHRQTIKEHLQGIELFGSQTADRPVAITRFSPNGQTIACGDWGGTVRLLSVPNLETARAMKAHQDRVGGLSWFPGATIEASGVSDEAVNLASAGGDGLIKLWPLKSETLAPIAILTGHQDKVIKIDFHPSGNFLASASHDGHWGFWDVRTKKNVFMQDGHSREVTSVKFQGDGSLLASAGMDGIGRVWDLRTGRTTMILEGHIKTIHGLDWGSDGHRLLTGSADATVRCWDLRMVKETSMIPGNPNGVTDLRWFKDLDGPTSTASLPTDSEANVKPMSSGTFYISSGFDKNVRIVAADTWAPIKTLSGHAGHALSTDVSADAKCIVSGGYDRTVKLWCRDDWAGLSKE